VRWKIDENKESSTNERKMKKKPPIKSKKKTSNGDQLPLYVQKNDKKLPKTAC
jgi:hypothetical protein